MASRFIAGRRVVRVEDTTAVTGPFAIQSIVLLNNSLSTAAVQINAHPTNTGTTWALVDWEIGADSTHVITFGRPVHVEALLGVNGLSTTGGSEVSADFILV